MPLSDKKPYKQMRLRYYKSRTIDVPVRMLLAKAVRLEGIQWAGGGH